MRMVHQSIKCAAAALPSWSKKGYAPLDNILLDLFVARTSLARSNIIKCAGVR